jgi:hypothetical protein
MGRPVRTRVSYAADAGFLTNLVQAVEKDDRQTDTWREETAGLLRQAAAKLLQAKQPQKVAGRSQVPRAATG